MEVYTTENEQVSALKNFFVENGKAIAAGLIIGIGGIAGWNYYQSHRSANYRMRRLPMKRRSQQRHSGGADRPSAGFCERSQ